MSSFVEEQKMQRCTVVARREKLEKAKQLSASGRYDEAARMYYELEMYARACECRRKSRRHVWDRRVQ